MLLPHRVLRAAGLPDIFRSLCHVGRNPRSQTVEISVIDQFSRTRSCAFQQQFAQGFDILFLADQGADIFAARAKAAAFDLRINKLFERFGKGDIHGRHHAGIIFMAKFGKGLESGVGRCAN
jgi:hypothetical protein